MTVTAGPARTRRPRWSSWTVSCAGLPRPHTPQAPRCLPWLPSNWARTGSPFTSAALPSSRPPWEGTPDQAHWHCATDVDLDDLGPTPGYVEAPYPLLVTIGESIDGSLWLLNCESSAPHHHRRRRPRPRLRPTRHRPAGRQPVVARRGGRLHRRRRRSGRVSTRGSATTRPARPTPPSRPRSWRTRWLWSTAPPSRAPTSPPDAPGRSTTTWAEPDAAAGRGRRGTRRPAGVGA